MSLAMTLFFVAFLNFFTGASVIFSSIIGLIIFYVFLGNIDYIKNPNIKLVYIAVILLKIVVLIAVIHFKPGFLSGVDWANFHNYATEALASSNNIIDLHKNSLDLFVFTMTLIYQVFGSNPDNIFLLVFLSSTLLFRIIFKTVKLLGASDNTASFAGLIISAWPVNVIYSSMLLRELPIQLVIALSFYFYVKYLKLGSKRDFYKAIILGLVSSLIHSGLVVVPIIYLYLYLQGAWNKQKKMIAPRPLIVVSVIVLALVASPFGGGIFTRFSGIDGVDSINSQYEFQLDATTSYIDSTSASLGEFIASFPYRLFMFSLSPLPWQVKGFDTAIAWLLDGILQVFVIIYLYRAWKISRLCRDNSHYAMLLRNTIVAGLLIISLSYAVFAMGTNNYGSAMRHRTKVLPVVVLVVTASRILRKHCLRKGDDV